MDGSQGAFSLRSQAPKAGAKNYAPQKLPDWATSLEEVLALALKTPGWNNRSAPPQFVTLEGGCQLVVIPAWLWRSRSCARREPACAPIRFPPRLHKVM